MLREERKRRRRKRRKKQVLAVLVLTGILSVSIIESAAHDKEAASQTYFTDIPDFESVKNQGLENIKPMNKDTQKNEVIDIEGEDNNADHIEEELTNDKNGKDKNNEVDKDNSTVDQSNANEKDNSTVDKSNTNEKDNFADAVFIGDSRTEGLQINTGLTTARFLAAKGLKVDTALKDNVIKLKSGSKGTVIDGLKEGTYNRVYLMFGMNELGWPYLDVFTNRYEQLIDEIKKVQPNSTIYIQSIIPVTKEKSDNDSIYNNENISKFNKAIKDMADENGYIYVDVASAVMNSNSSLPSDASSDGVHLNKEYSQKWLNYLRDTN